MYFYSYKDVPRELMAPYKNFSFEGDPYLYCPTTGAFYFHKPTMDALQKLRDTVARPLKINSGHRSNVHNARVGGQPLSAHLYLAFDIGLPNGPSQEFADAAFLAGFKSFGYYQSFLHVDMRPENRRWYGSQAAKLAWQKTS